MSNDSPEPGDRHWLLLGMWNVSVGSTLTVVLYDSSYESGDMLCVGDAMIHAIWPTVSLRTTNVQVPSGVPSANAGDYVDWFDASNPRSVPVEGDGLRLGLQVFASIESLYYLIPSEETPGTWYATLPDVDGLDFWMAESVARN